VDSIRRPYDVATVRHPRKFVFWGTSNGAALRDATGNTRYVTIAIPDKMLPLEWAEQNRCALWARAVEQYKARVNWNQCSDEIRDAIADRNANFTEVDPWTDRIAAALKRRALELQVPVQVADLLQVVEVPVERQRTTEGQRVRRIAESLGWAMDRRQSGVERRRGLWPPLPQAPQQVPQAATRTEPSHCNGPDPAATSATTKPKELERKEEERQQQHPRNSNDSTRGDTFDAFHMARVAARPEPLRRNESELPAHMPAHMAAHVAPVSNEYISGWVDPAPAPVGSGADAFDSGDDPAWGKRAA
jgi:predicted P-loop ATPase